MVVPLARIILQQPPIATLKSFLKDFTDLEGQRQVLNALEFLHNDIYKEQVLHALIIITENNGQEVDSDIWEAYFPLKNPAKIAEMRSHAGELSNMIYGLTGSEQIAIKEDRCSLTRDGETGHRTWESSLALTEFICEDATPFHELSDVAIELGAGTGLVSLALAKLHKFKKIYATDGSPRVVNILEKSADLNQVADRLVVKTVDWSDIESVKQLPKGAVVFAGDILYGLSELYPQIIDTLIELKPKKALFCNPIRNPAAYEEFRELVKRRGFDVKVLRTFKAEQAAETNYMFIVSVPPIPLELIELTFSAH